MTSMGVFRSAGILEFLNPELIRPAGIAPNDPWAFYGKISTHGKTELIDVTNICMWLNTFCEEDRVFIL